MTPNRSRRNDLLPGDRFLVNEVCEQQAEPKAESKAEQQPAPTKGSPPSTKSAAEVLADIMDALHVARYTSWDELPHLVALRCRGLRKNQLHDLVKGCLQDTVTAGGPIYHNQIHVLNATKRITRAIHAAQHAQRKGDDIHG
ncbi:MAG: hypothetical protein Q8O14_14780 [bacterium]|nr:hypothetical protein [bacterium]